ncbi:MAG: DUF2156 domain-containing protein [Candidatus Altiarchaeota archaeon]|nr:DUF2156 domain-containing protein [Candidatus Altiarchaeota archaeon]
MIRLTDYNPVTLKEKTLFKEHYEKHPVAHCENLYTTLVSWSHYMPAFYLFRDGQLYIMNMKDGRPQFRPPVGERNESALKDVIDIARRCGDARAIIAIEEGAKDWIESVYPDIRPLPDRDFYDYVYLSKKLADLAGKHYERYRNHLNAFRRLYDYSVEELTAKNLGETREFLDRWCLARDCEREPMLEAEVESVIYCMDHFRELGLSGIALRIDGTVQALSIYEEINRETVAIHYEKAMPGFEGIYPAINNEAAKILAERYKYINRQSDLGIKGLRTAKKRLRPDHMEKLYYIPREGL